MDSATFDKLTDLEQDMEFIKTKYFANIADRLLNAEEAIQALDTRTNIFVPVNGDAKGFEAAYGKIRTIINKHSKSINDIKRCLDGIS